MDRDRTKKPDRRVVDRLRWGAAFLVLLFVPGFVPLPGAAQTPAPEPDSAPPVVADTMDLVFDREVFSYPTFQRRNPFRPLTGADSGPRFEDLVLLGVIVSSTRTGSIATVGERPPGSGQQTPTRTHRLREGQVLGNTRILEIRDQVVLVQVEEFGLFELRSLELRRMDPEVEAAPVPPSPDPMAPEPGAPPSGPPPAGEPGPVPEPGVPEPGMPESGASGFSGPEAPAGFPEKWGGAEVSSMDPAGSATEQRLNWSGGRS